MHDLHTATDAEVHANAHLEVKAIPSGSKQSLCLFKGADCKLFLHL